MWSGRCNIIYTSFRCMIDHTSNYILYYICWVLLGGMWGTNGERRCMRSQSFDDETDSGVWGWIKLCIFEIKGWKEDDVEVEEWTAAFQIEMGRWHGLKREERVCKEYDSGEVEVVCHWLLQCSAWDHLRQPLLEAMDEVREDFSTKNDGDRTALILSLACLNYHILSIITAMWSARFY